MSYTKINLLSQAVEITKEAARGGNTTSLDIVLNKVYEMLKKLNEDVKSEE